MRLLVCGLLAAAVAGCGTPPPPESRPALTVAVTLDGQPAARLSLQLLGPNGQPAGGGISNDAGKAAVGGTGGQPIPPGTYKVVVVDAGATEENPMEVAKGPAKSRVPAAYGRAASTPLTVTVEAGKTDYPLELKSKG